MSRSRLTKENKIVLKGIIEVALKKRFLEYNLKIENEELVVGSGKKGHEKKVGDSKIFLEEALLAESSRELFDLVYKIERACIAEENGRNFLMSKVGEYLISPNGWHAMSMYILSIIGNSEVEAEKIDLWKKIDENRDADAIQKLCFLKADDVVSVEKHKLLASTDIETLGKQYVKSLDEFFTKIVAPNEAQIVSENSEENFAAFVSSLLHGKRKVTNADALLKKVPQRVFESDPSVAESEKPDHEPRRSRRLDEKRHPSPSSPRMFARSSPEKLDDEIQYPALRSNKRGSTPPPSPPPPPPSSSLRRRRGR